MTDNDILVAKVLMPERGVFAVRVDEPLVISGEVKSGMAGRFVVALDYGEDVGRVTEGSAELCAGIPLVAVDLAVLVAVFVKVLSGVVGEGYVIGEACIGVPAEEVEGRFVFLDVL